ncbi:PaaI family thioesterase [Vagococcus intermedius]|uniref:Hotdog fold thioesterase n=1 Tax=Vagococcus intermedius TaxID=2991418 RepID=A0AAF0CVW8_9ENTE|nr:hotdog fold thioesterase [Vagococcus intermedius]WEG73657.1 hotdog fold thioesterase [Vagococcus intermedius]WEG75741.1 hotdog fold thioesterase [Vagococcus intermedius]
MTAIETLGIKEIIVSQDRVVLELDIKECHRQPFGLVHGGVSALMAETAASLGATTYLDTTKKIPVGMDIHSRHVKSVKEGRLNAIAKPISIGKTVQIWEIEIIDQQERLICHSTCSLLVIDKP